MTSPDPTVPTNENPQQAIHLTKPDFPTIYVEGMSQMLVGFPNSRILLHSMAQRDITNPAAPEVRHIACELVMPTSAAIELAQNIISGLSASKPQMETVKLEWLSKLDALTNSLPSRPTGEAATQP